MVSVILFVSNEMETLSKRAMDAFKLIVPDGEAYSICNMLEEWDAARIIAKEAPCVVVAVGNESAECLRWDGITDFVKAPNIIIENVSRAECLKTRSKIQVAIAEKENRHG